MKRDSALGFIETVGLASAIVAADAAQKSANVELIGREISKGQGWVTVKITGDVAAVQAAIDAAKTALATTTGATAIAYTDVIARPAAGLSDVMVRNKETTLNRDKQEKTDENSSYTAEESILKEENIASEEPSEEQTIAEESTEDADAEHIESIPKQEAAPQKNAGNNNRQGKRKK